MKVVTVVGNRPQFVKAAPLSVAFREAGIEIPFPQRDITIRDWPKTGGIAEGLAAAERGGANNG